ncbi:hypothetical protein MUK42_25601 [Musa troglodytarum]|uniref:Uncharacterized protein n=2 Tax=Musa troglodytarum TaxID=320322 RepID=A0A9E7H5E7_9LILI|nr:hypothetical protein MUK42_25601 [Musa troglodytarum]
MAFFEDSEADKERRTNKQRSVAALDRLCTAKVWVMQLSFQLDFGTNLWTTHLPQSKQEGRENKQGNLYLQLLYVEAFQLTKHMEEEEADRSENSLSCPSPSLVVSLQKPSVHNPNCIASSLLLLLHTFVLGSSALKVLLAMEAAIKLKLFAMAMMAVVMAASMVQKAAAAQAPAPSPTSGAPTSSTTAAALASVAALAFGYLLC